MPLNYSSDAWPDSVCKQSRQGILSDVLTTSGCLMSSDWLGWSHLWQECGGRGLLVQIIVFVWGGCRGDVQCNWQYLPTHWTPTFKRLGICGWGLCPHQHEHKLPCLIGSACWLSLPFLAANCILGFGKNPRQFFVFFYALGPRSLSKIRVWYRYLEGLYANCFCLRGLFKIHTRPFW